MKYRVNENCIGCGLCNATCPEVYSMTEEGTAKAIEQDVPQEAQDSAKEAMESCPVDAIEEA